jgi:uncharacterized membrane protein YfcA
VAAGVTDTWVLLAIGAALGMVIGLLGGGGGILAVPLLVAVGQPFLVASSQSLVIVGAGAAAALVPHHRAGRVDWRVGLTFGAIGAIGAIVGARLAVYIAPAILLGGLTVLLVGGAVTMIRAALGEESRAEANALHRAGQVSEAPQPDDDGTSPAAPGTAVGRIRIVTLASAVGLVTGLLGVGAGFIVIPALVSAMKLPIKKATATALVVIVMNSAVAAVVRHGSQGSLRITLGLAAASATFAVVGALVSRRVPGWMLSAAFAVLMILVAIYTVVHTLLTG